MIVLCFKGVKATVNWIVLEKDYTLSYLWLPRLRTYHSVAMFECLALEHSIADQRHRV